MMFSLFIASAVILSLVLIISSVVFILTSGHQNKPLKNKFKKPSPVKYGVFSAAVEYRKIRYYFEIASNSWLPESALTKFELASVSELTIQVIDFEPNQHKLIA